MFEFSWGELGMVMAVGVAVVGRKDLPAAARTAGNYTGRMVGWLQGMRSRADRFTAQNELATLQNQVRSSMRQLQAVQAEVMSASSVNSQHLSTSRGSTTSGYSSPQYRSPPSTTYSSNTSTPYTSSYTNTGSTGFQSPSTPTTTTDGSNSSMSSSQVARSQYSLPPARRTIAAVAESEWSRQGLGFTSRAERGSYYGAPVGGDSSSSLPGSVVLARALQESLIHDQYDRVVREQQEALNYDSSSHSNTNNTNTNKDDTPEEDNKADKK